MATKKKSISKSKEGTKLIKLSSLSKAEIAKTNFDDLWVMKPEPEMAAKKPRPRYCGCRNVCLV